MKIRLTQFRLFHLRLVMATALWLVGLGFGIASSGGFGIAQASGGSTTGKIAPWVLQQTADGKPAEILIVLTDQADLTPAEALRTKEEKSRYVRDVLWNKAQTTQTPLLQWLTERNIEHRSYYIVNLIWAKAGFDVIQMLAARPDVLRIDGNPQIRNQLPKPDPTTRTPMAPEETNAVEPGVNYTNAPQVWALGYTGQGITLAGADTGYRWDHSALKNHYRGWDGTAANHDYNWHDSIHDAVVGNPCGSDSPQPCDDDIHGTHTMGTAVGDDGGSNQIGMAPGAKWMGCRNMDEGTGTPARYIECMEFFLAPYPVNGTPAEGDSSKSPDVTTNSWGCPSSEGCSADTLQAAVEAQRAAGIMMVVAAGNGGPACTTVSDPPGIYEAAYSIGALTTGSDSAASFSSRGPVIADMSLRLKPDLSAPGTSTRSSTSTSTTSYGSLSGTSMATPHVAGAVALVLSAAPSLRGDVTGIETILNETAVPIASGTCDATNPLGTPPNNTYGYGRLDVKAAVDRALTLLRLTGAASRKTHSGSDYDIDLPLSGAPGVECRSGPIAQDYTIVLHFNNPVTTGSATVSAHNPSGAGNVSGSPMFSGNDMFVNLTGVTNQQVLTLTLSGVTDTSNQVLSSATVNIGFLVGDVNGSGRVDAADVSSVRQQTLQTITASNFRNDLNVSGRIDAADVSIARQQTLTSLP